LVHLCLRHIFRHSSFLIRRLHIFVQNPKLETQHVFHFAGFAQGLSHFCSFHSILFPFCRFAAFAVLSPVGNPKGKCDSTAGNFPCHKPPGGKVQGRAYHHYTDLYRCNFKDCTHNCYQKACQPYWAVEWNYMSNRQSKERALKSLPYCSPVNSTLRTL